MGKKIIWNTNPPMDSLTVELVREDLENRNVDGWNELTDEEVWEYYLNYYIPDEWADKCGRLSKPLSCNLVVIQIDGKEGCDANRCEILSNDLQGIMWPRMHDHQTQCVYIENNEVFSEETCPNGSNRYLYRMLKSKASEAAFMKKIQGKAWNDVQKHLEKYTQAIGELVSPDCVCG